MHLDRAEAAGGGARALGESDVETPSSVATGIFAVLLRASALAFGLFAVPLQPSTTLPFGCKGSL